MFISEEVSLGGGVGAVAAASCLWSTSGAGVERHIHDLLVLVNVLLPNNTWGPAQQKRQNI